jgi:hypothetical protein
MSILVEGGHAVFEEAEDGGGLRCESEDGVC